MDIDLSYDGSFPLERLKPPEGSIFRQCTIRKWTRHNTQVAARRRCRYILAQIPKGQSPGGLPYSDWSLLCVFSIREEIMLVEDTLLKAIANKQNRVTLDNRLLDILELA